GTERIEAKARRFVPRSEARRPEGPAKLPPTSPAPLALRRAGTVPHCVGDQASYSFVPRSEARGKGPAKRGGGRPVGPGKTVFHPVSRRDLRLTAVGRRWRPSGRRPRRR